MVETLTESFCERCGTRYEFRAPTRLNPLRKTRGFIGGLKNYLTSQDALGDALGDAMRSEEDQLASAQLDAFHETFNFCIGCRQYTCVNCWHDAAGRCRTCEPIPGTDDLAERLLAIQPVARAPAPAAPDSSEPMLAGDELSRRLGLDGWPGGESAPAMTNGDTAHAWPDSDAVGGTLSEAEPEPEPILAEAEPEPEPILAEAEPEPEPIVAEAEPEPAPLLEPTVAEEAQPWIEPQPEPDAWVEVAPQAAIGEEPEPGAQPLRVVAWDNDSAYDVVEPAVLEEPVVAEVEPEPILAEAEPEPEPVVAEVEPEPEPVVAEVEPEPLSDQPAVDVPRAMPQVAPISETILRFPARPTEPGPAEEPAVAAQADTPELAARRAQLDLLGLGDPGEGPIAPDRPAVIPYRSRGATPTPAEMAIRAGGSVFWEASAREVAGAAAQIGVQNCGECGLSLSATARFCRRCGTRQARSA